MPTVSTIRLYPIKSLDGIEVDSVPICDNGRIKYDREYALFDEHGSYVNGRQNQLVHRIQSTIDIDSGDVALAIQGTNKTYETNLDGITDDTGLENWLSEFFEEPITIRESQQTNFADSAGGVSPYRITATGPTVISTATLREVSSWYADLTVDDIRRRLRTNIEISDVVPFWEDTLFSDCEASFGSPGDAVEFTIGNVTHFGIMPKPRCVVPSRDPDTGELKRDFSIKFLQNRKETFPEWVDVDKLGRNIESGSSSSDNYFYLTVVTRIPRSEVGESITIGDRASINGEIPLLQTH